MSAKARILVVDDERSMQEFLEIFFRSEGYDVVTAGDVDTALLHLDNDDFDVIISDIQMPERSGIDLLHSARDVSPEAVVIMITAFASTETAISAMKEGAYDYVTKPFKVDELRMVVDKALEKKLLSTENRRLRKELSSHTRDRSIIGNSAAIRRVSELVAQVADSKANVLISGESGTGKEIVARAIHRRGARSDKPFVAVNCAAIPETLLESELFGHVKGAFTGAVQNKAGLFETADGGTLFLDEIGELPTPLQVKLLRVLQEEEVRSIGESKPRAVDVRIIAATARDLEAEVAAGRFRDDLFYRLNVVRLEVPPLRERREDIPLLLDHFFAHFRDLLGKPLRGIADEVLDRLVGYHWPGNVRELENVIERAVILARGDRLGLQDLPDNVARPAPDGSDGARDLSLKRVRRAAEAETIRHALHATGGNRTRAARLLEISHRALLYKIKEYGIRD